MTVPHSYVLSVTWPQNASAPAVPDDRTHTLSHKEKPSILCGLPAAFGGDAGTYNPEELLLGALSSCHMLIYLFLCTQQKLSVVHYRDEAILNMVFSPQGIGTITQVTLRPEVVVREASMVESALALHQQAHERCLIARACNFPVVHQPSCTVA
jgi:organic hydroperoxide reductase OsmC/OhrA